VHLFAFNSGPVSALRQYIEAHRSEFGSAEILTYIQTQLAHIHIWAGILSLLAGIVGFASLKGKQPHRISGRIFTGGVAVVVATAFAMFVFIVVLPGYPKNAGYKPEAEAFLLSLASVAAYTFLSGYRWAASSKPYLWFDPLLALTALSAGLLALASVPFDMFVHPLYSEQATFPLSALSSGLALVIFGVISFTMVYDDFRTIKLKSVDPNDRIIKHATRIGLAFVAVLTGVVVINLGGLFVVHRWDPSPLYLLPGSIVAPFLWSRISSYRKSGHSVDDEARI